MSHNIETMAYSGKAPWHGLGNAVDRSQSIEAWLQSAGLDWTVSRRLVRMATNRDNPEALVPIPGFLAITRDSDNKVFQVASDRYHPIQNSRILGFFREFAEAGSMSIETAGALNGGSVVWALASLNKDFSLPGGDVTKGYVLLAHSHDGTLPFIGQYTGVRVVCWNTLSYARANKQDQATFAFRMKHSRKFDARAEEQAKRVLVDASQAMEVQHEVAAKLADSKIDTELSLMDYVAKMLAPDRYEERVQASEPPDVVGQILSSKRNARKQTLDEIFKETRNGRTVLKEIFESPGAGMDSANGTWWGALNGVTHWADHTAGNSRDTALHSSWFGPKQQLKNRAAETALVYAER